MCCYRSRLVFNCCFKDTWHFTHTWGMVGSLVTVLLHIFSWFWQWNNFKNRSIFDEVKRTKNCAIFWSSFRTATSNYYCTLCTASQKLEIFGTCKLVLEDGTEVDDDDVLQHCVETERTLVLLRNGERMPTAGRISRDGDFNGKLIYAMDILSVINVTYVQLNIGFLFTYHKN